MSMGKVTIYYLAHVGKGIFDGPEFTKAFRKADVIDFEACGGGVKPHVKKMLNAVSHGDRKAYEALMAQWGATYDATKDTDYLHFMQELDLIFGSGKRIEFEEKIKPWHYERVKKLFPGVRKYAHSADAAKLIDEAVRREGAAELKGFLKKQYKYVSRLEANTLARCLADSERIAREMRVNPGQNMLVLRGGKHEAITKLLQDEKIPVDSMHMPVRHNAAGTPLHGLSYKALMDRVAAGKPITASDVIRSHLERALLHGYLAKGWSTPDAVSQTGFVSQRLSPADLRYLKDNPHEIGGYLSEKKKMELFKPWWKRASNESLPFAKKLVFGAKRWARGYRK